jgi:hypothetical protein
MEVRRHQVRTVGGDGQGFPNQISSITLLFFLQCVAKQCHETDRRAFREHFFVHICPSPFKQMTPLTHIPRIHDTFPTHFDKLVMVFGRANSFYIKKIDSPNTPHNWWDSESTMTQQPIHSIARQTPGMCQRV